MKVSRIVVVSLVVLVAGGLRAADKKSGAKEMEMDPAMQEAMKGARRANITRPSNPSSDGLRRPAGCG